MNIRDQIVFSAFFHDIGKLYERAEILSHYSKDEEKQQGYCPKKTHYYSHKHVLYTLAFCEKLLEKFPILDKKYTPKADNNWVNTASRHHKPSNYIEEHIVQLSDWLASAEREGESIYEKEIHKKTLLEPLLEKISLNSENKEKTKYRIPLKSWDSECKNIFPKKGTELCLTEKDLLSDKKMTEKYQALAEGLLQSIQKFPEYKESNFENLRSLMQSFLYQCERFLIHVPSATNVKEPDISLFDHLRVTAAIAEALYCYHEHTKTLTEEDLKEEKGDKFLLVCGDFSGIQNFIYNIVSKGAVKSLTGRSLYIQLFCDAVSEWLLRSLSLYPTCRIYSSGAKFYLLISSHLEESLLKKADEVNRLLFEKYQAHIYLNISSVKMTKKDFNSEAVSKKFNKLHKKLDEKKHQRFSLHIKEEPEQFFSPQDIGEKVCSVCGSDKKDQIIGDDKTCEQCKRFERLGKQIRTLTNRGQDNNLSAVQTNPSLESANKKESQDKNKLSGLLWLWCKEDYQHIKREPKFNDKIFDFFQYKNESLKENKTFFPRFLIVEDLDEIKNIPFENSHFEFVNELRDPEPIKGLSFSHRFIASCDELNLDVMANKAEGIKRVGILRMDVDNLGQIFIKGLTKKTTSTGEEEKYGSLSRYASLSRQLNAFFSGYLNVLIKSESYNSKLIYAGGDDLFIIGPWNELPDLAHKIQKKFQEYCCHNPDLNLSAGITLIREKEPVLLGADLAGEAEKKAKSFKRQAIGEEKKALCFLDQVIGWEEYSKVLSFKKNIEEILKMTKSKNLLQVLYSIEREEKSLATNKIVYRVWRHRFVYFISRLLERTKDEKTKEEKTKEQIKKLQETILNSPQAFSQEETKESKNEESQNQESKNQENKSQAGTDQGNTRLLEYLYMPVCWADYLQREKHERKRKAG